MKTKAKIQDNSFLQSIENEDIDTIIQLIQAGVDVNAVYSEHEFTALHLAIFHKNSEIVDILIAAGANPNASFIHPDTYYKISALSWAVVLKEINIVKQLIEHGADCYKVESHTYFDMSPEIEQYIKFGEFIQTSCTEYCYRYTLITRAIFEDIENAEKWIKFAKNTLVNYALKIGAIGNLPQKIESFTDMPRSFKEPLCEVAKTIIENCKKSLEILNAELLYQTGIIDYVIPYSALEITEFTTDDMGLEQLQETYKLFKGHETPGFCVTHFAQVPLTNDLSLLAGFMKQYPTIKEGVEFVLNEAVDCNIRQTLTKALAECNNSKFSSTEISDMIVTFQLSLPDRFYPELNKTVTVVDLLAPNDGYDQPSVNETAAFTANDANLLELAGAMQSTGN